MGFSMTFSEKLSQNVLDSVFDDENIVSILATDVSSSEQMFHFIHFLMFIIVFFCFEKSNTRTHAYKRKENSRTEK